MTVAVVRTTYGVGAQPAVLAAYADALEVRETIAPLVGLLTVEIGPLNSAVEIFSYPDRAARDRIADAMAPAWPDALRGVVERSAPEIYEEMPFSPPLGPGSFGPVYELRRYEYPLGAIDEVAAAWAPMMAKRCALSPFVGGWWRRETSCDVFLHLWGYPDLETRSRVRAEAVALGVWPPPALGMRRQESTILLPAPCSPLQ